jgi:DNA-binding CsgD family transcriptional regulator
MFAQPLPSPSAHRTTTPSLSPRQLECLAWAQEGKSAVDIGQILGISGRTVEGHLALACEALGVRTRIQAVLRARDLGLIGVAIP